MLTTPRTFFLTTIPGLESVAYLELCDKWQRAPAFYSIPDYPEVTYFRGGVEFKAPLGLGLELNQHLRIPNRILLRIASFDASEEHLLHAGLEAIDWSLYFPEKSRFDFQLSSRSSKVSMKRQVQKVMEQVLKPLGVRYQKGSSTVFVRIFRDECNISIDCSGEIAFKRGQDKQVSIASLRESTASGLLRVLFQGIDEPFELIDPMCGSGTFLSEALQINQRIKRRFNYQSFPILTAKDSDSFSPLPPANYSCPSRVIGFDNHSKAVELAQKNGRHFNASKYHVSESDLFGREAPEFPSDGDLKRVVILNPPWGKRLPGSSQDVLKAVYERFNPDRIGFLMPSQWKVSLSAMEKVRDLPILNSGVDNRFLVFAKSPEIKN